MVRFGSGKQDQIKFNTETVNILEVVKRVGDLDLRITTQCIQQKNVTGRNGPDPSTMANICLKLNAKLGGVNNLISRDFRYRLTL